MCDVELLAELRFTAGLPAPMLAELASLATVRAYSENTVVFREGAECADLFVVQSGHVALEMHVPGRGSSRILTVGEGEFLGWSALLGDCRMTATATTMEPTRLVAIPAARLRELCEAHPEIGYRVMRQMAVALSHRLVATRLQLLDLFLLGK